MLSAEEFEKLAESATFRPDLQVVAAPAPKKLAPHGVSLLGEINTPTHFADSRVVVLYNPAGDPAWNSTVRVVIFTKAEIENELADDPLILQIAWKWLEESLSKFDATAIELSGTVTRTSSKGFGAIDEESPSTIEIRASWSPPAVTEVDRHVSAWGELVCLAAGVDPEGVTTIK
ncbi:MAG: hypothetical protein RIT32_1083 [Actinomycetota bacterium]|jgi:hypothetical protein